MENTSMKLMISLLSAAALAAAFGAQADTRSSDGDKRAAERKASPSAPKQTEEQAGAHSQPNNPHPQKGSSASGGSSAPAAAVQGEADREQAFKKLDLDGDGSISKAEAAGNAVVMNGFDRADKNRDGKLSRAEYAELGKKGADKPRAKSKAKSSQGASRRSD
jgi:hypothetical protein